MNLFLHGVIDGQIAHGDTLAKPAFHDQHGRLQTFDVVLANPPYSIKAWNRDAFAKDPYGRNMWGVPPQGRADYAFFQHIAKSLNPRTGRAAILFPHGVLFRREEAALREAAVKSDLIECVLGLGVQSWLDAQPATFRNTVQVVAMDASCVNHGMSARSRPISDRDSGLIGAISR